MRRELIRGVLAIIGLLLSIQAFGMDCYLSGTTVIANGIKIYTFPTGKAFSSADHRAHLMLKALEAAPADAKFTKAPSGANWNVMLNGKSIVTIFPTEAKLFKVSAQTLAATITQRLIDALALPALFIEKNSVIIPPDREFRVKFGGALSRSAKLNLDSPTVLSVAREPGFLVIKPISQGSCKISVTSGDTACVLEATVAPYSLNPNQEFIAEVSGQPADAGVVAGAVATAIQSSPFVPRGVTIWAKVLDSKALASGASTLVQARVKAIGSGYFPFEGIVNVKVKNSIRPDNRDDFLWYSNQPERIEKTQRLYWAELKSDESARLLYHHQNATVTPFLIRYMLCNTSSEPAKLVISFGECHPDKNPTRAGYVAGDSFMQKWVTGSAEVVTIPPNSAIPVSLRSLRINETCSGLVSMRLLPDGAKSVILVGDSILPSNLYSEWYSGSNVLGAWHSARPKPLSEIKVSLLGTESEVFPEPLKEERMDYEAGGRFGFARIGDEPLLDRQKQSSLAGNFGVVYHISGTLSNPTPAPVEVELLFEASAGYGSGLFIVNGDYLRLGLINPKKEIVLTSIKIPPGQSKPLRIVTIPLSGANYPVTLIVRPTGFE